jgi:hypothetical protein
VIHMPRGRKAELKMLTDGCGGSCRERQTSIKSIQTISSESFRSLLPDNNKLDVGWVKLLARLNIRGWC